MPNQGKYGQFLHIAGLILEFSENVEILSGYTVNGRNANNIKWDSKFRRKSVEREINTEAVKTEISIICHILKT